MPLRHRRLLAALSPVVLASCAIASVSFATPAAAATSPARPAAVSALSASEYPGTLLKPLSSGSAIEGTVSSGSGAPLGGLNVSVCETSPASSCSTAVTSSSGTYVVAGLSAGTYSVNAVDPPLLNGSNFPIALAAGSKQIANLVLLSATELPQGVSIPTSNTPGPPVGMFYGAAHPFSIAGRCPGGTASFTIVQNGTVITPGVGSGAMTETPVGSGTYDGVIPAYSPDDHGYAEVTITVTCGGVTQTISFCIWLDPSGTVISPNGVPIDGATVTLLTGPTASGPFTPVPNGSTIMSPSNRVNPGVTAADGLFGWDVLPGWYEVEAQKAGCFAPTSPPTPIAVSPPLQIPPAVTGLLLTLECS
jgi:Carboxypeptidase regulatory-like domain